MLVHCGLGMRHTLQFHLGLRVDGSTSVVCSCISPNLTTQKGSLLPFRSLACRSAASTTVTFKRPMLPLSVCMSGKKREHRKFKLDDLGSASSPSSTVPHVYFLQKYTHIQFSHFCFLFLSCSFLICMYSMQACTIFFIHLSLVEGGEKGEGKGERRERGEEGREEREGQGS